MICRKQIQFVKKFGLILPFSFFQTSNGYYHKILQWISRVLMKLYYVPNTFDLHICDNEMASLLKIFEICKEMHFASLFFLKERNIKTSLLMIHLKCSVLHYANLNSSSMNRLFLNCGP